MGLPVPKEIQEKLNRAEENMDAMVSDIADIKALLEEQTEIMRGWNFRA